MANPLPRAYAPMLARAQAFAATASWLHAGLVLFVLWFGFRIVFTAIFTMWSQSAGPATDPDLIDAFIDGSTPGAVRWNLAVFAIYTALLLVTVRGLHACGLRTLIGAGARAWREFWRVSLYLSPLYALLVFPSLAYPEAVQQLDIGAWILLLPTVLPLLFVQISAEELVFRGYLQSHLAALVRHPIVWMGLPSFLFGLIHYDPFSPSYSAWAYVVWATCLGLVCADLTARSGTLGPALAVHFINNISALVLLAADDWLYGAALFVWQTYGLPWEPWIPYEALVLLCVWLAGRLALRR